MGNPFADNMECINDIKGAIMAVIHPNRHTKRKMTVPEALTFYYKIGGASFVVAAIVELVVYMLKGSAVGGGLGLYKGLFGLGLPEPFASILMAGVILLVFAPLSFFINSAIYQFICKDIFGIWRGNYSRTFTASVFSYLPIAMLFWGIMLPYVHPLFMAVAAIWSIIVLLIALSNQQGISVLRSAGAMALTTLSVMFVAMLLGFAMAAVIRHLGLWAL